MNNTLNTGLRLIEILAASPHPMGITEIANKISIGKSNAHRILQALVEEGYALKDDASRTYRASLKIWAVGHSVLMGLNVRTVAPPFMTSLLETTRETIVLSVLDGIEVIYIDKLDSPEAVHIYAPVGQRAPAFCMATGKALLAYSDAAVVQASLDSVHNYPGRDSIDPVVFEKKLQEIRVRGYALNPGEWREGAWGVAAPIFDATGAAVAAIGVSGPQSRISENMESIIIPAVVATARNISMELACG
ncbi:IclR family transcriptional regulator [Advenella incenata]|jgi:DNA-binding IclR family transcriptional regulator